MGTAEGMLVQARRSLGLAGRPNYITRDYSSRNGSGFLRAAWCNMGITYWARRSGNHDSVCLGKDYAYTVWHAEAFERAGRWYRGTAANLNKARPGDIVFFDWGGTDSIGRIDHVGIIEKVLGNGRVQTIEANTGDACKRKVRGADTIAGYGRPAYGKQGGSSAKEEGDDMLGLKKGDKGSAVRFLQLMVESAGGKLPKYGADSHYGDETAAAVRQVRIAAGSGVAKTDARSGDEITPQTLQQIYWEFAKKAVGG